MTHTEAHPFAGQTVALSDRASDPVQGEVMPGTHYRLEDWWDRVSGGSWMDAQGNPAAIHYAMRAAVTGLPLDDKVVYGKIGPLGHLVHVSELSEALVD